MRGGTFYSKLAPGSPILIKGGTGEAFFCVLAPTEHEETAGFKHKKCWNGDLFQQNSARMCKAFDGQHPANKEQMLEDPAFSGEKPWPSQIFENPRFAGGKQVLCNSGSPCLAEKLSCSTQVSASFENPSWTGGLLCSKRASANPRFAGDQSWSANPIFAREPSWSASPNFAREPSWLGHCFENKCGFSLPDDKGQVLEKGSHLETLTLEESLSHLDRMSQLPSVDQIICTLQKCRKNKDLGYAKCIHENLCSNGMEDHMDVGNNLVPLFIECGSLPYAMQIFNRLSHRNVLSWTSLIFAHIQCGQLQHSFTLYQKMQHDGVYPSTYTFVALLKACTQLKDISKGHSMHVEVVQSGLEEHVFVGSTLVDMYAKCGSLVDASDTFKKLPCRNIVSWNALIAGYAEHGPGLDALNCMLPLQQEGIPPDAVTFVCMLKACSNVSAVERGQDMHTEITQKGLETDVYVGNALVDMYAKCGSAADAYKTLDMLPIRDVVSWTALISGFTEHNLGEEALRCFQQMQMESAYIDAAVFVCVLKSCGSIKAIEKGQEIHEEITQKGLERGLPVGNALLCMYVKSGYLAEAQEVFKKLPIRDVVSWNAVIAGYIEHGLSQDVVNCFEKMKLEGITEDEVTFVCMLKACGNIGAIDKGGDIHMGIVRKGFERDLFIGNTLVDMYAKCGALREAQEVFYMLSCRNAVTWTALIAGHAEHGSGQEVLNCLTQMGLQGVSPNDSTFVYALKACGKSGLIEKGQELHMKIAGRGLERELFLGSALVDMYAKCGSLAEARKAFEKLPSRNTVSWTSLIAGYAEHGPDHEALNCFEQMQLEGVSADAATLACTLKVCTRLGATYKGQDIHREITQKGFEKDDFLGNSLVDMYSKCGLLAEAQEVFQNLSVRSVVAWSAIIKGYSMNHKADMVVQFFDSMQEQGVEPDAITFTCLLSACSRASLVPNGQEFFKVMREKFGIVPTVNHLTCMVDLLARSGNLHEAMKFVETIPGGWPEDMWTTLLSACKTFAEVGLGLRCFEKLVQINPECATPYVLMANIYTSVGRWEDAHEIEGLRKHAGAKKKPAIALIEVNNELHEFVVGDTHQCREVSVMLEALGSRIEAEGHVPNLDLVSGTTSEE